jgi:hypothetical protein
MTNDELSAKVAEARGEAHTVRGDLFFHNGRFLPDGSLALRRTPKPYATDLNEAGKLADEMAAVFRAMGTEVSFAIMSLPCSGRWNCVGGPLGADTDLAGDTIAEAICNAYLVFKRKVKA